MGNIFDIINNFINSDSGKTYADIINENKDEVRQNSIKRMCSTDEYEEYQKTSNFDKSRLINESRTNTPDNYLMGSTKPGQSCFVSGIGEVKQIC